MDSHHARLKTSSKRLLLCALFGVLLLTASCAGGLKRNALPLDLAGEAAIPDVPYARFWGNEWPEFSVNIFNTYSQEELKNKFPGVYGVQHTYLAISGGGAEGAFGAGLLVGWTTSGMRPEFSIVTGISTGALTAPFAFLGKDYDPMLTEVYTTTRTSDILTKRGLISAAFGGSAANSAPLRALIETYINDETVEGIAREYQRGRKLLIGTFNLDAGRSVIWDIGAIAASSNTRKKSLIHDIILASASIPVAFPPVMIEVRAGGQVYDEMHVDGGTGEQVFVYPASFKWREILKDLEVPEAPRVFVIRNSLIDADYNPVKPRLIPIAARSVSALIDSQSKGDLVEIFLLCKRDGNDFNLAYIPADFDEESSEPFDPQYMGKLYQLGFDMAAKGYDWKKTPPGF